MPSDPTLTLTLQRVHRLLRPLRASLTALRAELDQHSARQSSAAALAKNGPGKVKGKGRASRTVDVDDEYTDGPPRKKRKVGRVGQVKGLGRQHTLDSSSPISLPPNTQIDTTALHPAPFKLASPQRFSRGDVPANKFDFRAYLQTHSTSPTLVAKAAQLARSYSKVLETLYPPPALARPSSRRPSPAPPVAHLPAAPLRRAVPSLAVLCARQVGRAIEANVRLCVEEASEVRDRMLVASQEEKRASRRQPSRWPSPDEEDATMFQDEWYAACPAHSLRHVLQEHSACILVEGLQDAPFAIMNAFFELTAAAGAEVEVSRASASDARSITYYAANTNSCLHAGGPFLARSLPSRPHFALSINFRVLNPPPGSVRHPVHCRARNARSDHPGVLVQRPPVLLAVHLARPLPALQGAE